MAWKIEKYAFQQPIKFQQKITKNYHELNGISL